MERLAKESLRSVDRRQATGGTVSSMAARTSRMICRQSVLKTVQDEIRMIGVEKTRSRLLSKMKGGLDGGTLTQCQCVEKPMQVRSLVRIQ